MGSSQKWLITGGAGYIGSHIADEFLSDGKEVIIYDSLYRGLESRIEYLRLKHNKDIPLIIADIRDADAFSKVLLEFEPQGIIHTAALKSVAESMEKPNDYMDVNFLATTQILKKVAELSICNFIFSSTAAVYGSPINSKPVSENAVLNPISPYGTSKLSAEKEVARFLETEGNRGTSLRFFNVVGTSAKELSDTSTENLIPIVINKLKAGLSPTIYGIDFPTPDGTCIRDFVDVRDVSRAHLLVANHEGKLPLAMNVGTGIGGSVREIIDMISKFLGLEKVMAIEGQRRIGDPALLSADVTAIQNAIGFRSKYSLEASINSLN
jgi:UDP-glucose 4-epimerase